MWYTINGEILTLFVEDYCRLNLNHMSNYTDDRLDQIWDKGKRVRGKDPNLYRRDKEGNVIYKPSYGKDTEMGWNVDHSKPKSKSGTDHLNNLQPLQTAANKSKGDKQ